VIVCGDDDEAARKAQKDVCEQLLKLDSVTIRTVDQKELAKLAPENWDLGDDVPKSFDKSILTTLFERGEISNENAKTNRHEK
jgi:hypothetical protein